jgi:hypothetical protein
MSTGDYEIKRVDSEDDPRRCQCVIPKKGQCINLSVPGSQYCAAHGGNKAFQDEQKKSMLNYKLEQWRWKQDLEDKLHSSDLKSLRDEIAILRVLMEERLNLCTSPADLVINSAAIADLVTKIERTVISCHKLEGSLGQLLDKNDIILLASTIIQIVNEEIEDKTMVQSVANRIVEAITNLSKETTT